jgi:hypothetical protein
MADLEDYTSNPGTSEANARLIASAPELYEALTKMLEWFGNPRPAEWASREAHRDAIIICDAARSALSKAEGKP